MATTGYDDRIFLLEVSGLRQQGVIPTSHYTFKVPYRSLARTLQFISRRGGKIVRLRSLSLSLPTQELWNSSAPLAALEIEEIEAQPLPASEADLEQSLPPASVLVASESTQPSVLATPEELASPVVMSESEILEPSKLPRLVRLFLKKLKHFWVRSE